MSTPVAGATVLYVALIFVCLLASKAWRQCRGWATSVSPRLDQVICHQSSDQPRALFWKRVRSAQQFPAHLEAEIRMSRVSEVWRLQQSQRDELTPPPPPCVPQCSSLAKSVLHFAKEKQEWLGKGGLNWINLKFFLETPVLRIFAKRWWVDFDKLHAKRKNTNYTKDKKVQLTWSWYFTT